MTSSDLSIAAIVPLYNGAEFLQEAIESVFAQSIAPDEFVIGDDGLTDDGPAIVERLQAKSSLRLFRKEQGGQSSARNYGVKQTSSSLIAFLDQDDVWSKDHLERLREPFATDHSMPLGWSYGDVDLVDPQGGLLAISYLTREGFKEEHPKRTLANCLAHNIMIWTSAALISREAFEHVSGFDEQLVGYEDDDFWLRVFRAGFHNVFLPRSLARVRRHTNNCSRSPQMKISRMVYAKKLLAQFRDNPELNFFPTSKCILPRFVRNEISDLLKAASGGDQATTERILGNLAFLESLCDEELRASVDCARSRFLRMTSGAVPPNTTDAIQAASDHTRELELLRLRVSNLEERIVALRTSWSWRITAPLRAVSALVKQALQRWKS